jgi:3-oxoacyl-[acyl-carrier protein] reductase
MAEKSYVIIGGTGGIGSVLSSALSRLNYNVFVITRSGGNDLVSCDYHHIADMAASTQAKEAFSIAKEKLGHIDGIVNLAGSIILKPAHITSDDELEHTINQNIKTAFNTIRYSYPHLSNSNKDKQSSIVLMSSVAGVIGLQNHEVISLAKAAVIGLTKSAAATYASKGIRINCIAPGLVDTPLSARITSNKNALEVSTALHPLQRIGQPEDVAAMIEFLLSDKSSWITGQVFGVDGGLATIK